MSFLRAAEMMALAFKEPDLKVEDYTVVYRCGTPHAFHRLETVLMREFHRYELGVDMGVPLDLGKNMMSMHGINYKLEKDYNELQTLQSQRLYNGPDWYFDSDRRVWFNPKTGSVMRGK